MSRYTVRVEGFQIPDYNEYTLNAENDEKAKEKAMERFNKEFPHDDRYDYIDVTIINNKKINKPLHWIQYESMTSGYGYICPKCGADMCTVFDYCTCGQRLLPPKGKKTR